jgi:Tol biopolymer transport system component
VSRFQREAEVLASLNHPNIAAIHDLDEDSGTRYLVLELVEGDTLADRIARGPIPVEEALTVAKQICEALEAAHERGVIHRDLKPANVKITSEGKVKVLDFGLAKAIESNAPNSTVSQSPTLVTGSMAGMIIGTAAYMSPEQARGMTVDHRTDIFAFGSVFYEMLTGRQGFQGGTVSDILASVLKVDPDWSRLPSETPVSIRRLLARCLKKEPSRRLQSIGDARIEIEETRTAPDTTEQASVRQGRALRLWISALAVLLAAAVVLGTLYLRPAAAAPEIRTEIVTPATSTSDGVSFALSPDGRRIVFLGSEDGQPRLWVRALDSVTVQPLPGTEGARLPFWSPDSRSVGFFAAGKLKRIDLKGGVPQILADATPGFGGSWNKDGVILFAPINPGPLFRVTASGGEAQPLTKPAQGMTHRPSQFLPDGRQFIFFAAGREEAQGIYIGSVGSSETRRLTAADSNPAYMPQGSLLYVRQRTLVARRFDAARRELQGDGVTVADDVYAHPLIPAAFSVSETGLVAYRTGSPRSQLKWFNRAGNDLGAFGPPDENDPQSPQLSPDGHRVALTRTVRGNVDIYILDSTVTSRFTVEPGQDQYSVWSPDGNWIAFGSSRKNWNDLYRNPSNGAGVEELILESPLQKNLDDWSPDGRYILYNAQDPKSGRDLWVVPLDENGKPGEPFVFLKTEFQEHRGQFSPDGHWVVYVSDKSGQPDIWIRPFPPGSGGEWQISSTGGIQPRWRPDGKELYYMAPDGKLMAVSMTAKPDAIEHGPAIPLFPTRTPFGPSYAYIRPQYAVAPDGRFLVLTTEESSTSHITLLQNWKPPLK